MDGERTVRYEEWFIYPVLMSGRVCQSVMMMSGRDGSASEKWSSEDTIPIRGCAGSDRLISWQQLNVFSVQGTFIKLYRTALKKAYLIFVTCTTGGARGEKICHVD